jgi:hypothetical protein
MVVIALVVITVLGNDSTAGVFLAVAEFFLSSDRDVGK